jgi:hypothetical protein
LSAIINILVHYFIPFRTLKTSRRINILTKVVKTFLIGVLLILLAGMLLLWWFSYEQLTTRLLALYGKPEKLLLFQTLYFTPSRYHLLQAIGNGALLLMLVGMYWWKNIAAWIAIHIEAVYISLSTVANRSRSVWASLSGVEKTIATFCIAGVAVFKLYCLPLFFLHTDEITSYLYMVERGAPVVMSYYPGPNNHILYLLVVCIFKPFVEDPFYLMKLPAWGISVAVSWVFFICLKKYFRFSLALMGMLLLSLAPSVFLYSVFGRGYILMLLFSMLSFFATLQIIKNRNLRMYWHLYVLSGILGCYTLVTFVYPQLALGAVILLILISEKEYKLLKTFSCYHLVLGFGVLLLYLPVFVFSGLSSIIANPWVQRISWQDAWSGFPELVKGALEYITHAGSIGMVAALVLFVLSIYLLIRSGRKKEAFLLFSFLVLPFVIVLLQRVTPFDRVWMYLVFPFCICLLILIEAIIGRVKMRSGLRYTAVLGVVVLLWMAGVYLYRIAAASHGVYDEVGEITSDIVATGATRVYTNDDTYNSYLRYHYHRRGIPTVPFVGTPSDSMVYEYRLQAPGMFFAEADKKERYQLLRKNEFIEVYKLK